MSKVESSEGRCDVSQLAYPHHKGRSVVYSVSL